MDNTIRYAFANQDGIYKDDAFSAVPSWKETLLIFAKNKGAIAGVIFITLMVILAVWGPSFNSYPYDYVQVDRQNLPPRIPGLEKLGIFDGTLNGMNMYEMKGCTDEKIF